MDSVRVGREAGVVVLGPRYGPNPNRVVRVTGPSMNVRVANTYEDHAARRIGRQVATTLGLPVDDTLDSRNGD